MALQQLEINAVRNLFDISLVLGSQFNVFYGKNGSGKTSLLEAIHLLLVGRSFRHHQIQSVIQHQKTFLSVFTKLTCQNNIHHAVGMEKHYDGRTTIRHNGENISSTAAIAELLPLQLIHPESDELVLGSPKVRRQFIDWGTFHVEQFFFPTWKRWQKSLKQRNAALKLGQTRQQVSAWDSEYIQSSEQIERMRDEYIQRLQPVFASLLKELLPQHEIAVTYQRGWPAQALLEEVLANAFYRDQQLGYTYYGPQRTDLVISINERQASEVLSRGEQKLIIIALRLAQGVLLKRVTGKKCLFLIDDISAELDAGHRLRVAQVLLKLDSQVLMTAIEKEEIKECIDSISPSEFRVEQGSIKPV